MSKSPMLRRLVEQRLSAAAEEIFTVFERTILEYEQELSRCVEDNQRKQRLLDSILPAARPHRAATRAPSPPGPGPSLGEENQTSLTARGALPHGATARVQIPPQSPPAPSLGLSPGPSSGLSPGPNLGLSLEEESLKSESVRVKEEKHETEEQRVKQEDRQLLPVPDPAFEPLCVKTEETSVLQHKEETQDKDISSETLFLSETAGYSEHFPHTDQGDDWTAPFSCSQTAPFSCPEAERDHCNAVQSRDRSTAGPFSGLSKVGDTSDSSHGAERKKYQCFVCHKIFGSKIVLQIHIRVHTGEKPYSCPICKKAFAQKNNLNAHKITHTGEKPYSCSLCKKTFGRRCTLKRHMKVHTAGNSLSSNTEFNCDLQRQENSHSFL